MDVDIEFARQAAEKAKAKKEAGRRDSEADHLLKQACILSNIAWDAWPDAWSRAAYACENQADTETAINALAKELESLVEAIRVNDQVANLALAVEQFNPSYCDGTDSEQEADAVKILIQALQVVVSDSDFGSVAGQLLSLDPLPVLSQANSAQRLIRVANDWPRHCEACDCIQPPKNFESDFCGECNLRGESMRLVDVAEPLKRPIAAPRQLMQSIAELDREIEEAVKTLELWKPGMDKFQAAQALIGFLTQSTGDDVKDVRLIRVRPALKKAMGLCFSRVRILPDGQVKSNGDVGGDAAKSHPIATQVAKVSKAVSTVSSLDHSSIVLSVEKWSDLAIGINEHGFFAVSPVPDLGAIFPIKKAQKLDLRGKRWASLLDLFANSKNGTTALKRDLFTAFGYRVGKPSEEQLADMRNDKGQLSELKKTRNKLAAAIGDLGRQLQQLVKSDDHVARRCIPLSANDGRFVNARFTTRHLVHDRSGRLQFGPTYLASQMPTKSC